MHIYPLTFFLVLTEGADVIAIDAFSKSVPDNLDIIIGIAFIRVKSPPFLKHAVHKCSVYKQAAIMWTLGHDQQLLRPSIRSLQMLTPKPCRI